MCNHGIVAHARDSLDIMRPIYAESKRSREERRRRFQSTWGLKECVLGAVRCFSRRRSGEDRGDIRVD